MPSAIGRPSTARLPARPIAAAPARPGLLPAARAVAGSAGLAALLAVPLTFAVFTERIFEAEKAGLLRVLGAVAVGAALVGAVSAWRRRSPTAPEVRASPTTETQPLGTRLRLPVVLAAAVLVAAELLATLGSVAPWTSALGSRTRGQGLLTILALVGMAAGGAWLADRQGGRSLLMRAIAAVAWPAALYAVIQRYGLDPLPWWGDVVTRVSGPAGSSVFLAAHLAMALPFVVLLVWRAMAASGRALSDAPPTPSTRGRIGIDVRLLMLAVAFLVTSWALVLAGSRGPVLGLAGGTVVAGIALAARGGHRRAALCSVSIGALAVAAVLGLNLLSSQSSAVRGLPLIGRLAVALDPDNSTTRVRLRLWEGSAEALARRPGARWLTGSGPETMPLVWALAYPPILAHDEPRGVVPDRAHNVAMDRLLTHGLVGLLAHWLWITVLIGACLGQLGLLRPRGPRAPPRRGARRLLVVAASSWAGAWVLGGLLGAAAAAALDGPRLVGPAWGSGAVVGLILWLTWRAWSASGTVVDGHRVGFAAAALAAVVAHWLELQVGFAITSTQLLLWLLTGALAVRPVLRPALRPRPPVSPPTDGAFAALVVGMTMVFAMARPGLVSGGTAVAGMLIVGAAAGAGAIVGRGWHRRTVVATLTVGGLYTGAHVLLLRVSTAWSEGQLAGAMATAALHTLGIAGLIGWRAARHGGGRAAPVLVAALVLAALPLHLAPMAADAMYKEGRLLWEAPVMELVQRGDSGRAESFAERAQERYVAAQRLAPWIPEYPLRAGFAADVRAVVLDDRLSRALASADLSAAPDEYEPALLEGYASELAARRDAAFTTALARFDQAAARAPGWPAPAVGRARALRLWGDLTRAAAPRTERLDAARTAWQRAIALAPTWPELRDEAATTALLAGEPEAAVGLAEQAIALDPFYARPWKTLAHAHAARGQPQAAAESWRNYFEDPRNAGDRSGLRGYLAALLALDRSAEAIDIGRRLVALSPDDARARADLAVALERNGRVREALELAREAARLAPGDAGIAALVERLAEAP